jgi:hypothetical protein
MILPFVPIVAAVPQIMVPTIVESAPIVRAVPRAQKTFSACVPFKRTISGMKEGRKEESELKEWREEIERDGKRQKQRERER